MGLSSSVNPQGVVNPRAGYAKWVLPLCWCSVALEGFDLVVLGVVNPKLLKDDKTGLDPTGWGLNANAATLFTTIGLIGVMVGALTVGPLADYVGRRSTMVWTVTSFSVLTLVCAAAPSPWVFGALRFLAGLGLGGVLPTALALINEYAGRGRGGSRTTTMMTGYHVGGVLTSLLGILVLDHLTWRWMFVFGALPSLVLVPLILKYLPESNAFLAARSGGRRPEQGAKRPAANNPVSVLFHHGLARSTVAFWITSFMGLLLVYGLNTWLPQIMRAAGYQLGATLVMLLVLNAGGVVGLLIAGRVADRIGERRSSIIWFALAAVFLALLSVKIPGAGVFVTVFLSGTFVFSAQVLVYAYVAHIYPAAARGSALGAASGVGRLGAIVGPTISGALLTAGIAYPWGFYMFALVAAIGCAAIFVVNRNPAPDEPMPVTEEEAGHISTLGHSVTR